MIITRRAATAGIAAALAFGGTAALTATQTLSSPDSSGVVQADRQKPRPTQPTSPPGLSRAILEADLDRPDEANTPRLTA
ncbi:hypothetical protein ABZ135_23435 [Streptomyces sp. NPDC006339]|uniref:hypothetical protein n=1 Tax=Streptomyces sp. NPDC006339 TaxID=3156755 RepID=UPI0033BE4CD2